MRNFDPFFIALDPASEKGENLNGDKIYVCLIKNQIIWRIFIDEFNSQKL